MNIYKNSLQPGWRGSVGWSIVPYTERLWVWFPVRAMCLGCAFGPWLGHVWEATNQFLPHQCLSLSLLRLSLSVESLSLSLSLYIYIYIFFFFKFSTALAGVAHGLSTGLRTNRSPVRFPVRAHGWVVGQGPGWWHARGKWSMFLSHINVPLSLLLPPLPSLWNK